MLSDDIKLAQKIISGSYNNTGTLFYHDKSFIYKFSNEEISSYQKYQKNKKKILSITASGDQILNSILVGSVDIKSCDISRFPKYFFELKKAAILNLTKDEFVDFFINESDYDQVLNDDVYDGFRNDLDQDDKKFWDSLFQFFEGGQIYNSFLFSHEIVTLSSTTARNVYLQDSNYNKLQNVIAKANISHYVGDIKNIIKSDHDPYDLVNLSSIIYYGFCRFDDYKKFIENINLNEDGVTLTYLYQLRDCITQVFSGDNYAFDMFKSGEGVMAYKKNK